MDELKKLSGRGLLCETTTQKLYECPRNIHKVLPSAATFSESASIEHTC
jgi:hypothetical protein